MIGAVNYANPSRRLVLITPAGKDRMSDIFAAEIWWHIARLDLPSVGQIVEFDVAPDSNGKIEAINIRNPQLPPPQAGIGDPDEVEAMAGAEPAIAPGGLAIAGNKSRNA